jgi:hypothetical protein
MALPEKAGAAAESLFQNLVHMNACIQTHRDMIDEPRKP